MVDGSLRYGAGILAKENRKRRTDGLSCIGCLGDILMIFECRARYLYLYAPFFVMLGVAGWVGLYRRVEMVARGGGRPCRRGSQLVARHANGSRN